MSYYIKSHTNEPDSTLEKADSLIAELKDALRELDSVRDKAGTQILKDGRYITKLEDALRELGRFCLHVRNEAPEGELRTEGVRMTVLIKEALRESQGDPE